MILSQLISARKPFHRYLSRSKIKPLPVPLARPCGIISPPARIHTFSGDDISTTFTSQPLPNIINLNHEREIQVPSQFNIAKSCKVTAIGGECLGFGRILEKPNQEIETKNQVRVFPERNLYSPLDIMSRVALREYRLSESVWSAHPKVVREFSGSRLVIIEYESQGAIQEQRLRQTFQHLPTINALTALHERTTAGLSNTSDIRKAETIRDQRILNVLQDSSIAGTLQLLQKLAKNAQETPLVAAYDGDYILAMRMPCSTKEIGETIVNKAAEAYLAKVVTISQEQCRVVAL